MHKKQEALQALLEQKLLPLYYHDSPEVSQSVLQALYAAGIRTLEYTNRGEHALDNFKTLRKTVDKTMPGLQLGIGTIKTRKQAKKFVEAGADFVVCPSLNEEVAEVVHDAGLLWIPGCLTTTEIATAEAAGATVVKIFPGNLLGPSYIRAIKDIFPDLLFMPTGGVEAEAGNLKSWFDAGVVAVGMGSKLISRERIEAREFDRLRDDTVQALELVQRATQP
ncbi:MAG TPA: bifunctional 4-hydroxy-2-oxoglutarate aldolase/2-dehydro-3-deoxy-phosphogluconate aldolase [Flavisolibacter sp.]|jgi:2-dehydro-3-deoxyphosphogluconate aldolase/(4S)-4-hydroxy-2-oxoglutarate aldolase|nr:bifunctional 4-hydroxy-2-oxoglutarate aldolase/2-dehydro-3-deoxy-phosphogluconate aldolase [Flavisolibacter sp.]